MKLLYGILLVIYFLFLISLGLKPAYPGIYGILNKSKYLNNE